LKGHIQQRGKNSWRLKFDAGRDEKTGQRKTQFVTFRGSKRQAQIKLAELIASVAQSKYVEPNKVTVAEWARTRVNYWEAAGDIIARTAVRYRQLVENQIARHVGATPLQKLRPIDIEAWHGALRNCGLAPRTIGHAHRVLSKALKDAVRHDAILRNAAENQSPPRVADSETAIAHDLPALMTKVHGSRLYVPAMVALFTGMRLGEVLALRWSHVDLDRRIIEVREALEYTKAHGIRFKAPKSKAGRRDITLPDILADILRDFRKEQLELRLRLGAGRLPDDALLFANLAGEPLQPANVSSDWGAWAPVSRSTGSGTPTPAP
jgi:integrase